MTKAQLYSVTIYNLIIFHRYFKVYIKSKLFIYTKANVSLSKLGNAIIRFPIYSHERIFISRSSNSIHFHALRKKAIKHGSWFSIVKKFFHVLRCHTRAKKPASCFDKSKCLVFSDSFVSLYSQTIIDPDKITKTVKINELHLFLHFPISHRCIIIRRSIIRREVIWKNDLSINT